jgi:hypothetical protein
MGPDTTFFSYARSDSDFVLKLARDLRQAGADVWLDQLDIKAGSRWDLSIETALKSSSKIMIILSPDSVASNNVMDEVSFALEEGKTVIPILLKPCDIPFRLKRLQYADFTKNYNEALKHLLLELKLGNITSGIHEKDDSRATAEEEQKSEKAEEEKLKAQSEAKKHEEEKILNAKAEAERHEKERKLKEQAERVKVDNDSKYIINATKRKKNKYKTPVIIAGIIIVLSIIIGFLISGSTDNGNLRNTEQLSENTDGSHFNNPQYKIDSIEEANSIEDKDWNAAITTNTIASYQNYQSLYPNGRYYSEADMKITDIKDTKKPATRHEDPITKKEFKPAQSGVETQKPAQTEIQKPVEPEIKNSVATAEKRIDLTGRWKTDEEQEWKLVQTGDSLEITWYFKKKEPLQAKTIIIGNYFQFIIIERNGSDIPGKFNIIDENTLFGRIGVANKLKVTRIQ